MNIKRAYHQSILLDNENVLIAGGVNKTDNETFGLKSAEIFNTKENKFVKISDMNLPHVYHSALKMKNGNIVIADINGIEIFDTKTNKFNLLKFAIQLSSKVLELSKIVPTRTVTLNPDIAEV